MLWILTLCALAVAGNAHSSEGDTRMNWDANSQDLGNGFRDHGVATPISNHRGTVATVDGEGRNVVLLWLYDHRGGYALLMIDAETGKGQPNFSYAYMAQAVEVTVEHTLWVADFM